MTSQPEAAAATGPSTALNKPSLAADDGLHEEEEVEDVKKQKAEGDFSGEYGKRVFCKRHFHSMTPLRIILIIAGRFPFYYNLEKDGTYCYKFHTYHPGALFFVIVSLIILYVLTVGAWDVAHIVLNFTISSSEHKSKEYQMQKQHEDVLIRRYFIPLIFVFSSLIHGFVASVLIIAKRNYIAHYLTFWSRAVYTMHMDVSRKALGFSVKVLILFIVVVTALVLFAQFRIGPSSVGLPTIFGDLLLRLYLGNDGWLYKNSKKQKRRIVQIVGAVILIFTFTASKSAIMMFVYHCKLLQSAFAFWNGRVYAAVLRGGEFAQTEEGRTTYKLLFKDHCVLMDLMEGMDQVFAFTMESYFGCQVFSLFFELYFCIRVAKHGDNRLGAAYPEPKNNAFFVRPQDWAPGILMMFVSVSLMLSAAKSAADVAEEAKAGLEVLRRKTMLGRKTDDELHFMMSMFSSYTAYKKMEITGAGYYYMNKDFIIGLISSVLSYFIILYQFQPVMDSSYPGTNPTRAERKLYGKFLEDLEGFGGDQYETTPSSNDVWQHYRG